MPHLPIHVAYSCASVNPSIIAYNLWGSVAELVDLSNVTSVGKSVNLAIIAYLWESVADESVDLSNIGNQ